jgi:Kef-type K+ transport system membrane component KefB
LGSIAIACAAADDVVAWLLLAVAVGIARPGAAPVPWWQPILLLGGYASIVMLIRPLLARFDRGPIGHDRLALIVLASVLSAAATEWIGIHALFGAFFIGLAMPKRREFVDQVSRMLEPLSLVALLPVFFAVTGLRMAPLALDWRLWADLLLIICIATAGKWGGAVLAGRFTGLPWREASSLGVLLNTRGLIQLVMLDIGKDLGILTPGTFSLLVIAALVTTAMTTPLLRLTTPAKTLAATAR